KLAEFSSSLMSGQAESSDSASSSALCPVWSARQTTSACPQYFASSAAGEAASAGGESKITIRAGAPDVSRSRTSAVRLLARNSLSDAVRQPAGSTKSPGTSVVTTQSSIRTSGSASASISPGGVPSPLDRPSKPGIDGLAKSASTSRTSLSFSPAIESARLVAQKVLPSPGNGEQTSTRWPAPGTP